MVKYSRYVSLEEKRNIRRAIFFGLLTIVALGLLLFFGLPSVAKFAGILIDLGRSNKPIEINDTTPPAPPRLDPLPEATNKVNLEITGQTEAGATVIIFFNGNQEEVVANADGIFSMNFGLNKGENTVAAKAKDAAGNESQESEIVKIKYDGEEPTIEVENPSDGSQFFGPSQRQVTIRGKTDPEATLTINDRVTGVKDDGSFTFATTLSEGENVFTLKAQDKAQNTSEKTLRVNFTP